MLVLKRKKDQEILIGHDIRIVVTEIHGGQVSLGITAPLHVSIDRAETVARRAEEALNAVRKAQGKEAKEWPEAITREEVESHIRDIAEGRCVCGELGDRKGDTMLCCSCGASWKAVHQ